MKKSEFSSKSLGMAPDLDESDAEWNALHTGAAASNRYDEAESLVDALERRCPNCGRMPREWCTEESLFDGLEGG
jgi:hypothetical protein